MKKSDKISIQLGKWSFLVSALALILSIYFGIQSNNISEKQLNLERESMQSNLVAKIEIDENQDEVIFYPVSLRDAKAYYKQKYILIINNIRQVNASITNLYLSLKTISPDSAKVMYGWFKGMEAFYYDTEGNQLKLPVSVEPNKPQKIIIEVGVKIPLMAWNKLPDSIQFNKKYDYEKIEDLFLTTDHLAMGQFDLIKKDSYGDQGNLQNYILTVTKGDGKRFKIVFFHNISDYLQGENELQITK